MRVKLDLGAYAPTRAHDTDAGLDIRATIAQTIPPRGNAIFHTGVHVELPHGTATTCLLLLETYMNAHPEMDLIGHFDERGCVSYELKKKGGPEE